MSLSHLFRSKVNLCQDQTCVKLANAQLIASTSQHVLNQHEQSLIRYTSQHPRQAGLCQSLCLNLRRMRINQLTNAQSALIPAFLLGRHVMLHAETGTGKSFGLALATLNRLLRKTINYRLHTLILVPTDELALQYAKWFAELSGSGAGPHSIRQLVYPVTSRQATAIHFSRLHNVRPHVLVGTPRALSPIVLQAKRVLGSSLRQKVDTLVLDEADALLSETYGNDDTNKSILTTEQLVDRVYRTHSEELPAQLIAVGATMDGYSTAAKLHSWMRNEHVERFTTSMMAHSLPEELSFVFVSLQQHCGMLEGLQVALTNIFSEDSSSRVLVIEESNRSNEDRWSLFLKQMAPLRIGRLAQTDRTALTTQPLSQGKMDVGLIELKHIRGLHIRNISHVIILGESHRPMSVTDFVHCVGRTGRMGQDGLALVLLCPPAVRWAYETAEALGITLQLNTPQHLFNIEERD